MRLSSIDGLRALAVLAVVAHHASFRPWALGTRGVDLFFVISGLCLSLPFLRERKNVPLTRFWAGRFWRIAPPYWVALLLFALLSLTAFGLPTSSVPASRGEFWQDALFFTSESPAYNSSFWTLGFEAHWYVLFPAVLALYLRSRWGFAALMLASYVWYATPYRIPDAGLLPCFMLGIVAADLYLHDNLHKPLSSPWVGVAAVALVGCAAFFDKTSDHGDPLWHLAAFAVVLAGLGTAARAASWKPLAFIGVASYSIYLVHQPLIAWLVNVHVPVAPAAVVSILAGIAFWKCVEVPGLKLRDLALHRAPQARLDARPAATPNA
jgi:peptidoglycan/LPS O-acetylase OafA/YrhL